MSEEALFTVQVSPEVGRYAVASRALSPGELIFTELPFAFGPKSDSPPLCLGCLAPADCSTLCSSCSWPVCSPTCETRPAHKTNECPIFTASKSRFFHQADPRAVSLQYECITPLRVLLAKETNPERWLAEVAPMQSHEHARKQLPIWRFNQINIVDYLRGPVKLHDRFSSDLIHHVCGILEVNAFEARTASGHAIRCLYPKLAILSHNCISNITHSIEPREFEVRVRASVDVPEKGELFSSYTYSLWPTLVRREFLKQSKFFECKCERCSDATELGSHLGTLKCTECEKGVVLSTEPLSESCEWKCTLCGFTTSARDVRKVYEEAQSGELHVRLHPKNAYALELTRKVEGEGRVELCKRVLEVLDVVEPGLTRSRGVALYELYVALAALARDKHSSGVISDEECRVMKSEALEVLAESATILLFEPEESAEGRLGRAARDTLKEKALL